MAKLLLEIELEYPADDIHGDDAAARAWFFDKILGGYGDLWLHSNEIGDTIGSVEVKSCRQRPQSAR